MPTRAPRLFPPEKRTFTQTVPSRVSLSQADVALFPGSGACAPPQRGLPASARRCACTCVHALGEALSQPRLAWLCARGLTLCSSSRPALCPWSLLSMPRRSDRAGKAMRRTRRGACCRISHTSSSAASSLRPRGEASGPRGQDRVVVPSPPLRKRSCLCPSDPSLLVEQLELEDPGPVLGIMRPTCSVWGTGTGRFLAKERRRPGWGLPGTLTGVRKLLLQAGKKGSVHRDRTEKKQRWAPY